MYGLEKGALVSLIGGPGTERASYDLVERDGHLLPE